LQPFDEDEVFRGSSIAEALDTKNLTGGSSSMR
jgi:hypothetical protein